MKTKLSLFENLSWANSKISVADFHDIEIHQTHSSEVTYSSKSQMSTINAWTKYCLKFHLDQILP